MPSTQVVPVSSTARYESTATDGVVVTVRNAGPDSCYYGTGTVSSSSNEGTLASGSTIAFLPSKFFISAGTSRLQITIPDLRPATEQIAEMKRRLWMPPGAIDETYPRYLGFAATSVTSGTLRLNGGAVIRAGVPVSSITFYTSVALVTPTHQWFCLVRESDNAVLAKTVNDTNVAWGINTEKKLSFATPYVPSADAAVYLGIVNVAGTTASIPGINAAVVDLGEPGPMACNADTGLTDPASLGATVTPTATAIAAGYGYYS